MIANFLKKAPPTISKTARTKPLPPGSEAHTPKPLPTGSESSLIKPLPPGEVSAEPTERDYAN